MTLPTQMAHHTLNPDRLPVLPMGFTGSPNLIDPALNDMSAQPQANLQFDSSSLSGRPDIAEQFTNWEHDE